MKNLSDHLDAIAGKRVILRADLDVPVASPGEADKSRIADSFRVERQREAVGLLRERAAKTLIIAHSGKLDSFEPIFAELKTILGERIVFVPSPAAIQDFLRGEERVGILDNLRRWPGETAPSGTPESADFASSLAAGFDVYVNNVFAECHRDYASISGIPKILPAYAGPVVVKEIEQLSSVFTAPAQGKIIVIGGAKTSTKIPVIKNLLPRCEKILLGGVVANEILRAGTGSIAGLDPRDPKLVLPEDFIVSEGKNLDIGPHSIETFREILAGAKMIVWNGPLGMFEDERFARGTVLVGQAIAESSAETIIGGPATAPQTIVGGGDTIAAIRQAGGSLDRFSFVSTGGGAMLVFLAGERLPGLVALGYTGGEC